MLFRTFVKRKKKKRKSKQTKKGRSTRLSVIIRSIALLLLNKAEEPSQLPEGEVADLHHKDHQAPASRIFSKIASMAGPDSFHLE